MIEQIGHEPHRSADAVEEGLIARAEVVEAFLTVRGRDEAVFGALAVAGEADLALQAVVRERVGLGPAEGDADSWGSEELDHVGCRDVAEEMVRLDEVVAGVEVAVVLEGERVARRSPRRCTARGETHQEASAASNIWTKTGPTSARATRRRPP